MTSTKGRIEALEIAAGLRETAAEATARALQQLPFEELERQVREDLATRDPPAADDMSEFAIMEREVRKGMVNIDRRREWEKAQWGHLPLINPEKARR